ncbi:patatin-like phospholipase family protein [Vibrio parahaemolyticus]|nr:patatin-like phospholipase family protein [Vibrio parahaemolyticus]EIV8636876.1 patatin-like phospholipase family protein [Vibrio parahaemolyticus]EIZ1450536.1 patatin-like phospholipase family protein [Vibrio parahaemolyticus]EJF4460407.1 patatin-like phospholipase family protein [Vibrio parahaemolyticus]EKL0056796.1 patatin-like phospholipase family protein [Vibrio parahaemolyticus]
MNRLISAGITVTLSLLIAACNSSHTLDVRVSENNYKAVMLAGVSTEEPLRFWASEKPNFLYSEKDNSTPLAVASEEFNMLALSGGGVNGAYGAGVLMGLAQTGQLKDYSVVTGISAGALIAPFVFVGGDALPKMKSVMLNLDDAAVLGKKKILNTVIKDAFTDGENFYDLIEDAYPNSMIEQIAEQHRNGKRLFIGTTHFDSGELMIWNVGAIANSELPTKVSLIHQVLAASSSIPGLFPPQFINVEYEGQRYEELHVDGGLAAQVFFNPSNFNYQFVAQALGVKRKPQLDVIRNGLLKAPYKSVHDEGIALLSKSVSSLTLAQARGDLYRMKYISEANNIDMKVTYIDKDFSNAKQSKDMFDKNYLLTIYDYGYKKASEGQLWVTELL